MSTFLTRGLSLPSKLRINPSNNHLPVSKPLQSSFSTPNEQTRTNNHAVEMDIWSSISLSKTELLPPYIHPLVKKAADSLSKKSLEICTESLGSETGSDGFASYPDPSQFGSDPPKCNKFTSIPKRINPPLPPALPSLNLQMRRRRRNGRLVMEAVDVQSPPRCFMAERENGRLVLTFSGHRRPSRKQGNLDLEDEEETVALGNDVATVTSAGKVRVSGCSKIVPCRRTLLLLKEPQCIAI